MKNLIVSAFIAASFIPMSVSAATPSENTLIQARINAMLTAAANHAPEVSLAADRYNTDLQFVMQANGITREAAIARIARALIGQNGAMPAPPIPKDYHVSYNPAPHAFQQMGQSFYAGVDPKSGSHVFTPEQRSELLDSFWYCSPGKVYTYTLASSFCK